MRLRLTQRAATGWAQPIHATTAPVHSPKDLGDADPRLLELLFLDLLELGYYIAPRGYMALSLALTPGQLAGFVQAVDEILHTRADLWAPAAGRAWPRAAGRRRARRPGRAEGVERARHAGLRRAAERRVRRRDARRARDDLWPGGSPAGNANDAGPVPGSQVRAPGRDHGR